MKYMLWCSFPLLLVLSACERIETRTENYPDGALKARWEVTVSKEGEHKNGVSEEFWENKRPKSIVNFLDDKEHGVYRAYHVNGKMEAEIFFIEGNMHGDFKEWYDNGNKKRFADYKEGKLHGKLKTWDSSGNLVAAATFKDGSCTVGDCGKLGHKVNVNLN